MKPSLKLLAVPLAVGALTFAGCGGSSDNSSSDTGSASNATTTEQPAENNGTGQEAAKGALEIKADPGGALAYIPPNLDGKAGKITVDFTNDSPLPHDIVFDGPDGKEVGKTSVFTGGSETAEFDAKPGAYTFYCSVPGHREGGMEGTLTVK